MSLISKLFRRRRHAYRSIFKPETEELASCAKTVMNDLRKFCRADAPTFTPNDPYTTALLEGRREVFNRIANHLNMTDETIAKLANDDLTSDEEDNDNFFKI